MSTAHARDGLAISMYRKGQARDRARAVAVDTVVRWRCTDRPDTRSVAVDFGAPHPPRQACLARVLRSSAAASLDRNCLPTRPIAAAWYDTARTAIERSRCLRGQRQRTCGQPILPIKHVGHHESGSLFRASLAVRRGFDCASRLVRAQFEGGNCLPKIGTVPRPTNAYKIIPDKIGAGNAKGCRSARTVIQRPARQ